MRNKNCEWNDVRYQGIVYTIMFRIILSNNIIFSFVVINVLVKLSSLLDPVVKSLSESENASLYRSFQRHQIDFYLAVIQFNLESSYRWNPHCSSPSEFIAKSECFDSKFAKMPKELKCVKLDMKEYKQKCEEDLTGFDKVYCVKKITCFVSSIFG